MPSGRTGLSFLPCRGCLGPLDAAAEAGLCGRCWSGLKPLSDLRCPRCALVHDPEASCQTEGAWHYGDALWDYHGGRPPLGSLLVPGIKTGERGWMQALLQRVALADLPPWAYGCTWVTAAPATPWRRWLRGMDLAREASRVLSSRLQVPLHATLTKRWWGGRQAGRSATERRSMPQRVIQGHSLPGLSGPVLLVDDVWTTGTTLHHAAKVLLRQGCPEVRVLTLFRSRG